MSVPQAGHVGRPAFRVRRALVRFGEHEAAARGGACSGGAAASGPEELVGEARGLEARGGRPPTSRGVPGAEGGLRLPSRACALPREVGGSHRTETNSGLASSPCSACRDGAVTLGTVTLMHYPSVGRRNIPSGGPSLLRVVPRRPSGGAGARLAAVSGRGHLPRRAQQNGEVSPAAPLAGGGLWGRGRRAGPGCLPPPSQFRPSRRPQVTHSGRCLGSLRNSIGVAMP